MKKHKQPLDNQITIYQSPDGGVNIEVLYANENIWLTQKLIAQLFECSIDNVSLHLKNIFADGELDPKSVIEEYPTTAADGKEYKTKHYSLEAIIAVGYRVNSERGTQFRQWATGILKNYIHKGYALDSNRFKYGSRFSARYFDELYEEIRDIRIFMPQRLIIHQRHTRASSFSRQSKINFILPLPVLSGKKNEDKNEA